MIPLKLLYFEELDSTNEFAKREYCNLENFSMIIADYQYKGKGRNNREWYSPKGENLYFSLIVFPEIEVKYLTSLPVLTGFSVLKTIESLITFDQIFLKWPNDIIVNNRKISGILIESKKNAVIIGVGINVNSKKMPDFSENKPTSLRIETGKFFDRLFILKEFFENFCRVYEKFKNEKIITEDILNEINENIYLKNEMVEVVFNEEIVTGTLKGINENGALIIDNNLVFAGDVKKVRKLNKER